MRILILGAGGDHRTEASIARAAVSLGHTVMVLDALGWRRRLGPLASKFLGWRAERFQADFVLCTRHAIAAGPGTIRTAVAGRDSAFWYFDAASPLPETVVALARLTRRTFATYGYQVDALKQAGAPVAQFLPQGLDPTIDSPTADFRSSYQCDVSFVGSGQYPRRYPVLQAIAPICRLQIRGPGWEKAPDTLAIAGGRLVGRELAEAISAARISFGVDALPAQRLERQGGTSNRLWRVLGAGGLFLGEQVEGIERFAQHDRHAVWYRSNDEAVEQVRRLLSDPGLRMGIALAGRAHALASHTYRHRLEMLLAGQGYTST